MSDRVGNVLYRLCILIGALAIGGTVVWNGIIFMQLHAAREAIEEAHATKPKGEALLDLARTMRRMEYSGKTAAEIDTYLDASGYTIAEIRPAQEWIKLHAELSSREMDVRRGLDVSLFSACVAIVFSLSAYCIGLVLRWIFQQPE